MGIDATVFCDCFERGRLRSPPRAEWAVHVSEDGRRESEADDLDADLAFDAWSREACEHEDGVLRHHYLGNIALMALFRELLSAHAVRMPVIVHKIIYNGVHAGDRLAVESVAQLELELDVLAEIHARTANDEQLLRHFEVQLRELAASSRAVCKPIAF